MALARGTPNSLIQLLLQSGADPHVSDTGGITALHTAARVLNVSAIEWLIAENVNLGTLGGKPKDQKSIFQFLLDQCHNTMGQGLIDFSHRLKYLRVMQTVVLAGAKLTCRANALFFTDWTQEQLIRELNWFKPKRKKLSSFKDSPAGEMKGDEILQEICDIVQLFTDMLSNPLSLKHLCRVQVRRSLDRDFRRKLHQLNVPLPLQDYLMVYKPAFTFEQDHSSDGGPHQKDTEHNGPVSAAAGAGPSSQWWSQTKRWPLLHHEAKENNVCAIKCQSGATGSRYDDVIKWIHFPRHWSFVRGIHRSPVNSPHKSQWRFLLSAPK